MKLKSSQSSTLCVPFNPDLGRKLKELGVPHACEASLLIHQIAFWLSTNSGKFTIDGTKWIYNGYKDWIDFQITTINIAQFGRMVRCLRSLGMIVTETFAGLRKHLLDVPPVAWHEFNTTTWWRLNLDKIFELTGWSPDNRIWQKHEVVNNISSQSELKPAPGADVHIRTTGNSPENNEFFSNELPSIYIKNHLSHQKGEVEEKENGGCSQKVGSTPQTPQPQNTHVTNVQKPKTRSSQQVNPVDQYSGVSSNVQNSRTNPGEQEAGGQEAGGRGNASSLLPWSEGSQGSQSPSEHPPAPPLPAQEPLREVVDNSPGQEVWEMFKGKPFPVFLNWRAQTHYKPQGGRWESSALGFAYSEFYNNRVRTTNVIFPEFLEEVRGITERVNQSQANEMTCANVLPSWFMASLPSPTQENVRQLMENLDAVIAGGVAVAAPNKADTPSSQTISYQEVEAKAQIKPLPDLSQPVLSGDAVASRSEEHQEEKSQDLAEMVRHRQFIWETAPVLRENIKKWASETPGVVVTAEGVMLAEPEIALDEPVAQEPEQAEGGSDFSPSPGDNAPRRVYQSGDGFGYKPKSVGEVGDITSDSSEVGDITSDVGEVDDITSDSSEVGNITSDSKEVLEDDLWESPPAESSASPPKSNDWVLSLKPGQWVRFKNDNGFWYKGRVTALHQERGYFIKVDIRYWSYGKTRNESIFRDDWLQPMRC